MIPSAVHTHELAQPSEEQAAGRRSVKALGAESMGRNSRVLIPMEWTKGEEKTLGG